MGCLSSAITDTGEGLQVSFFRKCQYGCKIEWGDWGFCRTDDDMDWCWQTSNLWFRDHSSSNPNSWNTWFQLRHRKVPCVMVLARDTVMQCWAVLLCYGVMVLACFMAGSLLEQTWKVIWCWDTVEMGIWHPFQGLLFRGMTSRGLMVRLVRQVLAMVLLLLLLFFLFFHTLLPPQT